MFPITRADAILLGAMVILAPAYSYYAGRRIAAGAVPARTVAYIRTMVSWWLIAFALALIWVRMERPAAALGLTVPGDAGSWAGAILCVLALAYVNGQWRVLRRLPPEKLDRIRSSFGRTLAVLPHTPIEYHLFLALSVTAGICEELLFRGYFFAMTSHWLTLAGSAAVSALVFGLGHAYQGWKGVAKTALAGLFLGAVYIGTGSLLWPAILHALIDVQGGSVGYRLLRPTS
ncbi:MAG TPA: CPBP family intramembrane glutamic endopeptidase [Candidatus Baltobacteraceae bacterium]|jgi:membrane protease YdiL (CAAX protease family)|nr:CPBP family intramembrane glutamic endopeptidase [Candidatus Baltobacteraceae bacterium]